MKPGVFLRHRLQHLSTLINATYNSGIHECIPAGGVAPWICGQGTREGSIAFPLPPQSLEGQKGRSRTPPS